MCSNRQVWDVQTGRTDHVELVLKWLKNSTLEFENHSIGLSVQVLQDPECWQGFEMLARF